MAAMRAAAAHTKPSPHNQLHLQSAVHFNLLPLLPCEVGAIFTSQMNKWKFTVVKLLAQSNTTRLLGARAGSLIPAPWALSFSL